jgi:hypothetical protein
VCDHKLQHRSTKDTKKILAIDFPRLLPTAALVAHFSKVVAAFTVDDASHEASTFYGNNGTMYSIGFPFGTASGAFPRRHHPVG